MNELLLVVISSTTIIVSCKVVHAGFPSIAHVVFKLSLATGGTTVYCSGITKRICIETMTALYH